MQDQKTENQELVIRISIKRNGKWYSLEDDPVVKEVRDILRRVQNIVTGLGAEFEWVG